MFNIPNTLTISRFFLAPFIAFYFLKEDYFFAFILTVIALLTDYFDGKIARATNQETTLGTFLDPIADKFYELVLVLTFYYSGHLPLIYVLLVWLRNLAQLSSIPILLWWKKISFKVEPKWFAKWASAIVMIILCLVTLVGLISMFKGSVSGFLSTIILNYILIPVSVGFELYMLFNFIPRFIQIYRGDHDTFD